MVVTDSFLFPPPTMIKVRVTNMSGAEMIVDVNSTWKCDKKLQQKPLQDQGTIVKIMPGLSLSIVAGFGTLTPNATSANLNQFKDVLPGFVQLKLSLEPLLDIARDDGASSMDPPKNSLMFKLLHLRTGATLAEDVTLQQQGVKNNDELLLLRRRLNIPQIETDKKRDDRKVADAASIRRATEHLPKKHHDCLQEEAISNLDFQSELKRILISLLEASERILYLNPEASKILKQAEDIYLLKEAPSRKTRLDATSVKQLTDMGFPENRARKALLLNQQSVMSAMDWLLNNEADPDIDKQLPGGFDSDSEEDDDGDKGTTSAATKAPVEASHEQTPAGELGAIGGSEEATRFRSILETIRNFQQKEFRPNRRALYNLVEMGFSEKDAAEALQISGNKENAACEWLLSDRKERPVTMVEEGLDVDSPVYKAIICHPAVQLGLNSPRCFLAFLQMLLNPVKAGQWLNDSEIGPLLMQISRIYHSEKLTPSGLDPLGDSLT